MTISLFSLGFTQVTPRLYRTKPIPCRGTAISGGRTGNATDQLQSLWAFGASSCHAMPLRWCCDSPSGCDTITQGQDDPTYVHQLSQLTWKYMIGMYVALYTYTLTDKETYVQEMETSCEFGWQNHDPNSRAVGMFTYQCFGLFVLTHPQNIMKHKQHGDDGTDSDNIARLMITRHMLWRIMQETPFFSPLMTRNNTITITMIMLILTMMMIMNKIAFFP